MATDQRYVDTDVAPGGDGTSGDPFASLSEWEATVGTGNSATDDYVVDCCGVAADTTVVGVNFTGNITTGSITIRANRNDPRGFYSGPKTISDQHYRMELGNVDDCIESTEANFTVDGIQCMHGDTGSTRLTIASIAPSGYFRVLNCRLLNTGSVDYGIGGAGSVNNTCTFENNLIVGYDVQGIRCLTTDGTSNTYHVRHNTIWGDGGGIGIYISKAAGSGATVWNVHGNAIANCATCIDSSTASGTVNADDNATADSTGQITGISAAAAWTSPGTSASSDFTVKDTSSPLYNAVNPTLVTDDITGYTRDGANHDVGAFEFQAGGGPAEYVITPSGGLAFAGSAPFQKGRVFPVAGGVSFGGTAPYETHSVERIITPSGGVVFGGTATLTMESDTDFVITPSGGVTFGGGATLIRGKVLGPVTGGLAFGGTAPLEVHNVERVYSPSGGVVFGGTAIIEFTSGEAVLVSLIPMYYRRRSRR